MLIPKTEWHDSLGYANATNTVFVIKMKRGLVNSKGIWAQEFYESRRKRNPLFLLGKLLFKYIRRDMEITSHEIEIQQGVIDGWNADRVIEYRFQEAVTLRNNYKDLFEGYTISRILNLMESKSLIARDFVEEFQEEIQRYGTEY